MVSTCEVDGAPTVVVRPIAWTEPAISELVVTSDGFVLVQREGEVGANELVGTRADLDRNLLDLIEAAGLMPTEIRPLRRTPARAHKGDTRHGEAERGYNGPLFEEFAGVCFGCAVDCTERMLRDPVASRGRPGVP